VCLFLHFDHVLPPKWLVRFQCACPRSTLSTVTYLNNSGFHERTVVYFGGALCSNDDVTDDIILCYVHWWLSFSDISRFLAFATRTF